MKIQLIKNERAIKVNDYLVLGDLHIGYEASMKGYSIFNLIKNLAKKIISLKNNYHCNKLIILGDLKYNIAYFTEKEVYQIKKLFDILSENFDEIIILKGNHDGKIENILKNPKIKILKEFKLQKVGFMHGHRKPSINMMDCLYFIIGHSHPTLKLKDKNQVIHSYPVWIIGNLKKSKFKAFQCQKVIIVPAFNPLIIGSDKLLGPIAKNLKQKEIIMLDLTKVY